MRRLVAAVAVLLVSVTAFADDLGDRTFTVEFGGRDEALREDCSRRLSAWWDEIVSPDRVPAGWDEKKLGPWTLVVRTSGGGFVEEKPGLVHVLVQVVSEVLPSRKETADAFAEAALAGLRDRVMTRAAALATASVELNDGTAHVLRDRVRQLEQERATIEDVHGGAPDARVESLTARRAEVDRDVAETRIQLAVAARKLDAARAAAERAISIERLRRDADALERRADAGSAEEIGRAREALAEVRRQVDELSKSTPSLDTARETVFQLEVERVGVEARGTVLAEERKALDTSLREVRKDVVRWSAIRRMLDIAAERLVQVDQRAEEARRAAAERGQVFEVIRPPGPLSKDEKVFKPAPQPASPSKEEKKR